MYEVDNALDLVAIQDRVLKLWDKNDTFNKSIQSRYAEGKIFSFYEGPPSANGKPGIHHILSRTLKDIVCRYKALQGYIVKRKGGWDAHGLPVEIEVEKKLGITKEDIGSTISVKEYNDLCRATVMKYKSSWEDLTKKMGFWIDLKNPYISYEKNYIESVWHLLKKLYDKNLLYKGYTIQPYSPAAGTGLSTHELNQPGCYKLVKDISIVAQFKIDTKKHTYLLAWTTTPWTLPANTALAVNKNIDYVIIETYNQYTSKKLELIIAKECVSRYFNNNQYSTIWKDYTSKEQVIPYRIIDSFKGDKLLTISYEQLMPYIKPEGKAFKVLHGDFVNTEEGTGIVHISPTFGSDDFYLCKKNQISAITVKSKDGTESPIVDRNGRYVSEITDFAGMYIKDSYSPNKSKIELSLDRLIVNKLKKDNKAFKIEKYEHNYPHCWRTDKPILYYPMDSWFIKTTNHKKELTSLNTTINWIPKSTGSGRFGNWLENLVDWNLSRTRFWGTPLPIWSDKEATEKKCIGSIEELNREMKNAIEKGVMNKNYTYWDGKKLKDSFDTHRPYVDEIVLANSKGEPMHREPYVIDVWFDSGSMPYAQWHYPFENKDIFEKHFPADFICEGVDQTRGWFFSLHAIACMLYDKVAFKNVISNGLVLDKKGHKMSKRLGNAVDPFETIKNYSADATRWYLVTNSTISENIKFSEEDIIKNQRKFFGTLHNTHKFFALYANLDNINPKTKIIPYQELKTDDKWILSRINTLIKNVEESYNAYNLTKAGRLIQRFTIDELSNWYVRLNRGRFWKSEKTNDKIAAYQTLATCLQTISQLIAPITPFYADYLYKNITLSKISVHLTKFPKPSANSNKELEDNMKIAQTISSIVHSLRKKWAINVRQPLSKILLLAPTEEQKNSIEQVKDIITKEINVKNIAYENNADNYVDYKIKPNYKKIAVNYKSLIKTIAKKMDALDQTTIIKAKNKNHLLLSIEGQTIKLEGDDLLITSTPKKNFAIHAQEDLIIIMDTNISTSLQMEGLAREFVNRMQKIRKDICLNIENKINIEVIANDHVRSSLEEHKKYIMKETQAKNFRILTADTRSSKMSDPYKTIQIGRFSLNIRLTKA